MHFKMHIPAEKCGFLRGASQEIVVRQRSQKYMVMKFEVFEGEVCGGFVGGKIFLSIFPQEK